MRLPSIALDRRPLLSPLLAMLLAACGGTAASLEMQELGGEASAPNGGMSGAETGARGVPAGEMRGGAFGDPDERATTPSGPPTWSEAPTLHFTGGPWGGCSAQRYDSGWVVGQCGELRLMVQAGFAGTIGPVTQRSIAGDRVGGYVSPRRVVIDGRSRPGADLARREPRRVQTLIGEDLQPDPEGRVLHRGIHARVRTPGSGAVGVTCHADIGAWSESGCVRLLERVARHGLPGGPLTERRLTVAGVSLDFSGERCWSPEAGEVYCFLDGGMHFASGTAARMSALQEQSIRDAPLAPRSEAERQQSADTLNANRERIHELTLVSELERSGRVTTTEPHTFTADDFPRMRVERHDGTCRVGDVESPCTRVDYYGALEHVAYYAYYARVPSAEGTTLVHCSHHHDEPAPSPCRQVFGAFVVTPTNAR